MEDSDASHFIILFKGQKNHLFKGLYSYDPELEQVLKVYTGTVGPNVLERNQVLEFYKYDSGSRTFKALSTKSFGRTVHAVAIDAVKVSKKMR